MVAARQLDGDKARQPVAPHVAEIAARDDKIERAVAIEVAPHQITPAGAEPLRAIKQRLGVGADVAEQVDAVRGMVRAGDDQVHLPIAVQVQRRRIGVQAHAQLAAHARAAIGDALAGAHHGRLRQPLRFPLLAFIEINGIGTGTGRPPTDPRPRRLPFDFRGQRGPLGARPSRSQRLKHAHRIRIKRGRQFTLGHNRRARLLICSHGKPVMIRRLPAGGAARRTLLDGAGITRIAGGNCSNQPCKRQDQLPHSGIEPQSRRGHKGRRRPWERGRLARPAKSFRDSRGASKFPVFARRAQSCLDRVRFNVLLGPCKVLSVPNEAIVVIFLPETAPPIQ